jgi:hypothetical protein
MDEAFELGMFEAEAAIASKEELLAHLGGTRTVNNVLGICQSLLHVNVISSTQTTAHGGRNGGEEGEEGGDTT